MADIAKKTQVAVIGGGAAGMMAAISAAELGAKVVIIERNAQCGKKLSAPNSTPWSIK